jgi:4-aminobutyrate aminotransferase/(S)-3-amino-2-methylpropionate transaminase
VTTEDWFARLIRHECPDATYRPDDSSNAVVLKSAEGSYLTDVNGKRYLDLCSGFGVHVLGHNNAELSKQLTEAVAQKSVWQGLGDVYANTAKIEFYEELQKFLPARLCVKALALSGSQAAEYAIKSAMLATKKSGFFAFGGAYHGLDFGALSLTARKDFREPFGDWLVPHVKHLEYGAPLRESFAAHVRSLPNGFAGVIVEPIQGRAGILAPPEGWLAELTELCHKHGGLVIYDEIFTGYGRRGKFIEDNGISEASADILCLGKPMGGGLPLSGCVGTTEAMSGWQPAVSESLHTGTFFGFALACALGKKVLEIFARDKIFEQVRRKGDLLRAAMLESFPKGTVALRGEGLMLGVAFSEAGVGAKLMAPLLREGIIAIPSGPNGEVLSLTPAYTTAESDLVAAAEKIALCFRSL